MTRSCFLVATILTGLLWLAAAAGARAEQIAVPRVDEMPNLPQPFVMKDWRATARAYDRVAFDLHAKGEFLPLVWLDEGRVNIDRTGFGLQTYVGTPHVGGGRHEAINCIAAVLGATLAGVDKTAGPHNWVLMCEQYFNRAGGRNLVLNSTRAGTGGSFWYEIWPSVLFFALADRHPGAGEMETICRTVADRWCEAVSAMRAGGDVPDFNHSAFNFRAMKAVDHGQRREPDAAAGVAWLEVMAYAKWKDPKHLEAAEACLRFLERRGPKANPYYEVLLPWGALAAARMNAELGRTCDVPRFVNWCFDGRDTPRGTWGVIADRWGDYDCHGLVGSLADGGGYAFAMNTFAQAGALVPLVRYDDRFARAIGKYVLNAATAARLFYPDALPADHQSSTFWKGDPKHVIAYEGLRKTWKGVSPYAGGDPTTHNWGPRTDLGLYGSSHVGFFGSIISQTNDEAILRLDCLATDFFRAAAYPTYLYYNPHADARTVTIDVGPEPRDLYDAATNRFLARGARGTVGFKVSADSAVLLVLTPAGGKVNREGQRMLIDGVVVDYAGAE
ncbi:MAG TPA: hypothetical protein VM238_09155 [Phycisphaerae bacterium]|nr:hypothetical protein [Phycisphaerae bacterium]